MDLPPSYESATGAPGQHNQINPYCKAPPSAPPPSLQQDDEIKIEHVTIPILPKPYIPRPTRQEYVRPSSQNSSQLTWPTNPEESNKICGASPKVISWCIIAAIGLICVMVYPLKRMGKSFGN